MITLTEILGRAEQGMTRPFVCRAAPLTYYVNNSALELPFREPDLFWKLP